MVACSITSDSEEDAKEKGMRKVGGAGKALPSFLPFISVLALSQFSGPDHLGKKIVEF